MTSRVHSRSTSIRTGTAVRSGPAGPNQIEARRSTPARSSRSFFCGGAGNAALIAFTSALGAQAQESGVRVLGINPAATRTDRMTSQARSAAKIKFGDEERWAETLTGLPFGRPIEPREIAELAVFLASPRGAYVNATVVDVDGGAMFRG